MKTIRLLFFIVATLVATTTLLLTTSSSVSAAGPKTYLYGKVVKNPKTGEYTYSSSSSDNYAAEAANQQHETEVVNSQILLNFTLLTTGWYGVEVSPNRSLLYSNPREAYYSMGLVEGRYTAQAISDMFFIHTDLWARFTPSFINWFQQNIDYMNQLASSETYTTMQGTALYRFMAQMQGITDGFNAAVDAGEVAGVFVLNNGTVTQKKLTFLDTFLMNAAAEFSDIATALDIPIDMAEKERKALRELHRYLKEEYRPTSHCSALFKLTGDDLYASHDTWDQTAGAQKRMFKIFHWETTVAFSSAPSRINSGDDYYITGNKLMILETTLIQDNTTLTKMYVKPNTMLYFLRIMASSCWTNNTVDFFSEFLVHNSGTYCNDNFVLDMKQITPEILASGRLAPNTLGLCEQMPGPYSVTVDVSNELSGNKYFGSYNIGWTKQVYDMTGNAALCAGGSIFCNDTYARPLIFARDQHTVTDLASMQNIMRYNGYLINDPLAKIPHCDGCDPIYNPSLAIACRSDQVPLNASFGNYSRDHAHAMNYSLFGAIDAKITSYNMMENQQMASSIISGPTTSNGLPPFDWSQQSAEVQAKTRGGPTRFDFPFVEVRSPTSYKMTWKEYHQQYPNGPSSNNNNNGDDDSGHKKRVIGAIVGGVLGLIVIFAILAWRKKVSSRGDGEVGGNGANGVQEGSYKQVV